MCPNNIATTTNDFLRAFFHDLTIAIRLFLSCFGPSGPAGCVCNILSESRQLEIFQGHRRVLTYTLCAAVLMRPAWVDNLPTDQMKCQGAHGTAPRPRPGHGMHLQTLCS